MQIVQFVQNDLNDGGRMGGRFVVDMHKRLRYVAGMTTERVYRDIPGLYQIQYRINDGNWSDHTCTSTTGNEAFRRLITRMRYGEDDPREIISCAGGQWEWRLARV